MYTAIIVDDEPHVCQLILHLVDWNALNIQVIGVAQSGKAAYALILEHRPNIVITDIRMPGIDGLELVRMIREKQIPSQFIIISGYRYFEYAHSALRYNVQDYLLKPIKKAELEDCLRKICSRLQESAQQKKAETQANAQLHMSRDMLHHHFLQTICRNATAFSSLDSEQLVSQYQLPFAAGQYQFAIFQLDDTKKSTDLSQCNTLLSAALSSITLDFEGLHLIRCIDASRLVLLLNYPAKNGAFVSQTISDFFHHLSAYIERFGGMAITGALGTASPHFQDLPALMDSAIHALRQRVVLGLGALYDAHTSPLRPLSLSHMLSAEQEHQLKAIITAMSAESFSSWFLQETVIFKNAGSADPNVFWDLFDHILQAIFYLLSPSAENRQMLQDARHTLDSAANLSDLCRQFSDLFCTYFSQQKQQLYQHEHLAIQRVKEYIAENYIQPLRLDDIAAHVHLNASYLSSLFKKETGSSITNYLTMFRLETSKKLLKSTDQTVAEISYAVGFLDAKYFTKLFSKEVGISPTQYRRLYQ